MCPWVGPDAPSFWRQLRGSVWNENNILEKTEARQNNRSSHMKRKEEIAHFMTNTLSFRKMRKWHPNQSHCDASGSTIRSLKHSLFLTLW